MPIPIFYLLKPSHKMILIFHTSISIIYIEALIIFDDALQQLSYFADQVLCLGDFNVDMFDLTSYRATQLLDITESFALITEPTRVTGTNIRLIDLIFTNTECFLSAYVLTSEIVADHFLVFCTIKFENSPTYNQKRTYSVYSNFNLEFFLSTWTLYRNLFLLEDLDTKLIIF